MPSYIDDYELEQRVLGTLIMYPRRIYDLGHTITEDAFVDEVNALVFRCLTDMASAGKSVDLVTLTQEVIPKIPTLPKHRQQDSIPYLISELTIKVISDYNLEEHIEILMDYRKRRIIFESSHDTIKKIQEGEKTQDIINKTNETLLDINHQVASGELSMIEAIQKFNAYQEKDLEAKLLKTYLPELDDVIGGFEYSDLIILAGAASMGKTSLMLRLMMNFVINNKPCAIFSREMSDVQLMTRIFAMETEIPVRRIKYKDLDQADISKMVDATTKIESTPLTVDGESGSLTDILNKIRKLVITKGVKVVFIDYLQLVTVKMKGNREQEVAVIARSFKNIAKELDIVVIALSQLSRALSSRDNKRPMLSDLRESGEIEQAADTIIFAYREEYYNMEDPRDIQDAELIVAKGRNVGLGTAYLKFIPKITKFVSPRVDMPDANWDDLQPNEEFI